MKLKKILILIPLISLVLVSCKKEVSEYDLNETSELLKDDYRTEFGKKLAELLTDKLTRAWVREVAIQRFDNDYDILVMAHLNDRLSSGKKIGDLFQEKFGQDKCNRLKSSLPLLTISVPKTVHFDCNSWNVEEDIPLVAVINSDHVISNSKEVFAYSHAGNSIKVNAYVAPSIPIIVVKENERVITNTQKEWPNSKVHSNLAYETETLKYYFIDESFNGRKSNAGAAQRQYEPYYKLDSKLIQSYENQVPSQRDFIYYNISTPAGTGTLDLNYAEYITGIRLDNSAGASYAYDDPTSDWTDGAYEFQFNILFFDGTSTLTSVSKVIGVDNDFLMNYETDAPYAGAYRFPSPIKIVTWDMQKYGDRWKYVVTELDPGTITTTTALASSTRGSNFELNLALNVVQKQGIGFGISSTQTYSNQTTYQVTQGSDACGEAISNFMDPVITDKIHPIKPKYGVEELQTGTVSFMVEPRHL